MSYKVNDLVRIIKQPNDLAVKIQGQVAIITEIYEDTPTDPLVASISINGDLLGWGQVPESCLALETDESWLKAKDKYFEASDILDSLPAATKAAYEAQLEAVASKYNLTKVQLLDLLNDLDQAYHEEDSKNLN